MEHERYCVFLRLLFCLQGLLLAWLSEVYVHKGWVLLDIGCKDVGADQRQIYLHKAYMPTCMPVITLIVFTRYSLALFADCKIH